MKKIIASVVCFILVFSLDLNVFYASQGYNAFSGSKQYSGEEILDLACSIWPEHEELLRNQDMKRSVNEKAEDKIVVQETYNLSDNEIIMYVERESGMAYAVLVENWEQTSQISGSGYVEYVGNLYAVWGSCTSHLVNFRYQIYNSSYDKISNFGTFSNTNANVTEHGRRATETATEPAYYTYQVYFVGFLGIVYASTIINFRIENNQFYCSAA